MMVRVGLLLAAFVIGLCQARTVPNRSKQVKAYAYVLPAGAEEIRDDINHSFVCANRTDGFYVDIDNDCQIFHRCQDRARFSFICAEKTVFSQMYQTCVHDGQLGFPCEDSAMFYPDAEGSSEAETENKEDAANKEQPAAEPSAAAAMPPSMYLLPPEEESMTDAANDEEKVIGTVVMPISDNYVNMFDHQQVNDDKFDPVDEDEKENTAQEVLDEQVQDAEVSESVPQEIVDSTQEVEVNDESNESSEASSNVDEEVLNETPEAVVEEDDEETNAIVSGIESDDNNEQEEPAAVLTEEIQPEYQSQLHNDVQEVEESEPVVQDVQADEQNQQSEETEVEVPKPVEPASSNDAVAEEEEESNSVEASPSDSETVNEPTQEDKPELPQSSEETAPNSENVVAEIELNDDTREESNQKVNEPLVAEIPVVVVEADSDDGKVDDSEAAPAEAFSEQQLVPEVDEQSPTDDQNETVMNEVHPLTATLAEQVAGESHPIDLPEFIVSTVADLRRGVVPPALRRRKTFLFKADAVSS